MSKFTKKFVAIATVLTVSVMIVGPGVAQGAISSTCRANLSTCTQTELTEYIAELMATLTALQTAAGQSTGGTGVTGCTISSFNTNLSQGMTSADVKCLQVVLNSDAPLR